ncbi:hypothetical protein [Mariniphaga anaerophila]|nr:hypothetical protein [Mariniphaga anaerophila]
MNPDQQKIALKVIYYLKKRGGISNLNDIIKNVKELEKDYNKIPIMEGLKDYELIANTNSSSTSYRLSAKGHEFETWDKFFFEKSLEIKLAKSNIEANELQKRYSNFNKTFLILNAVFAAINILIAILL